MDDPWIIMDLKAAASPKGAKTAIPDPVQIHPAWFWLAIVSTPCLNAQHIQWAATFGGGCTGIICSYTWLPDTVTSMAVDPAGNVYVTGISHGNFPLLNAIESFPIPNLPSGANTPFAAKIDPSGTKLLYATLIGGVSGSPGGVAIDSVGNAYITGGYSAADGPTFTFPGISGKPMGGAFLVKLDPNGKLLLSTLFGGSSGNDAGTAIALDGSGAIYISGNAASQDFPVTNGPTTSSVGNIFLTRLDGVTGRILYSTLLGSGDTPQMTLGSQGDLFIAANTTSTAWPVTTGALQSHCAGTTCADVIALRFQPSTSQTIYATYLGGSGKDQIGGVTTDPGGSLYVSGTTTSIDFPVTGNGLSEPCAGVLPPNCGSKAFVARLNPSGSSLVYATYLGGNAVDIGRGIAIDGAGNAYVTGQTTSTNFPVVNAFQPNIIPNRCFSLHTLGDFFCGGAAFVTALNPNGSQVLWSTYLGQYSLNMEVHLGNGFQGAYATSRDTAGNVYVAGSDLALNGFALSPSAAAAGPFTGTGEATVLKIAPNGTPPAIPTNALVNAASYAPGLPFAGGLASLFLSSPNGTADLTLKVGGETADILAVAQLPGGGQQINFRVPPDRGIGEANSGAAQFPVIEVDANNTATYLGALPVAPGIFALSNGSPAVQHAANYALVSSQNPIQPGETIIIYATGLGGMVPQVSLSGTSCNVLYAGPAPGYPGLDQINCHTASKILNGPRPLQLISPASILESGTPSFATNSNIVMVSVGINSN